MPVSAVNLICQAALRSWCASWGDRPTLNPYDVYTGLVGSSWKPFSPLNPPILGDFEDAVSPKLGGG